MEHNPLAEQLQRLQRWATNVFQPAARCGPRLLATTHATEAAQAVHVAARHAGPASAMRHAHAAAQLR
jgi:hypothetical protein